jgi:hypothetical protein
MGTEIDDPIEILTSFDLDQLVYHTISLLNVPVGALERDNSAIAASYAIRKAQFYVEEIREIEIRRGTIGVQVREDLAVAEEHRATDPDEADRLTQVALHQLGGYEIQQHFFTVCAAQIRRMLTVAHRIVGVPLDHAAEEFLESYQPLRNQFEHLDERLPGQERGGRLVLDIPGRMMLGLNDDGTGRITVQRNGMDIVAEVNLHGVEELERIVAQSFEEIRAKCIEHLEGFLADHPELTTDLRWIQPMVRQRHRADDGEFI